MNVVYVGMPRRGEEAHAAAVAGMLACTKTLAHIPDYAHCSLLTHGFNILYAKALNLRVTHGVTHFAMIHSDVCPDAFWLDVLMSEMLVTKATMISAVVPQRSGTGVTSTAMEVWKTEGGELVRQDWQPRPLTLKEVFQNPATWTHRDLLVNTGLFLLDLRFKNAHKLYFRQQDRIVWQDGKFVAETIPEDWDFSRQVKELGGTVWATRKVKLYHGSKNIHNHEAYGE